MIDTRVALSVFIGTLPIFGMLVWNLIEKSRQQKTLRGIRADAERWEREREKGGRQ